MNKLALSFVAAALAALPAPGYGAEPYPAAWAPLSDDLTCSSIIGRYTNRGEIQNLENYNLGDYRPWLSDELFSTIADRVKANTADTVEILRQNGSLQVRATKAEEVLASTQYEQAQISCKQGWLVIAHESGMAHGNGNVVLGYSTTTTMLHLATDGSLVVKRESSGAGMAFLLVPVAGNSVVYERFFGAGETVQAAEKPTRTGDVIGSVTMLPDGSLTMLLRSVQCDGMIAESEVKVLPTDDNYRDVLDHVGGLKPSETKPVLAWPTPPCQRPK